MPTATVAREVRRRGVGVHSGVVCEVVLRPAPPGAGWRMNAGGRAISIGTTTASAGEGSTRCGPVRTVEHLLAALAGLDVWDVVLDVSGPEIPILDGSARPWIEAIDEAGRDITGRRAARRLPACRVEAAGGIGETGPGADCLRVEVDFGPQGPIGRIEVPRSEAGLRQIASARTFVHARNVDALRAAGRGRGADESNTVVWPTTALRMPDEPVRHKALDAWGDLALLGPVSGEVRIVRGSHALHHALLRALEARLRRPGAR